MPEQFPISESMRHWAKEKAPDINLARETEKFLDHHRAKGSILKDWVAAWRNWMRHAEDYRQNRPGNGAVNRQPPTNGLTPEKRRVADSLFRREEGQDGNRQNTPSVRS